MAFGLGHGQKLDDAPGVIGVSKSELGTLPDDILKNPESGRVDPRLWFAGPARRFEIEIGCGKGSFILQEAAANPETNYLGIEYAGEFYAYTADRLRRRGLGNVRMLHADATDFLRWRCPANVAAVIHLYFSDPWPKTKHHKNRVIQHRFLAEVWRVLVPGGELRVVTDHDELWMWDQEHFAAWADHPPIEVVPRSIPSSISELWQMPAVPFVRRGFTAPIWVEDGQTVGTNYERKMCDGRPPHACVLTKVV